MTDTSKKSPTPLGEALGAWLSRTGLSRRVELASVIADLLWYAAGRAFGYRVLSGLCRLSLNPASCVSATEERFMRWGVWSLVVAKFVPGFSTVAPPIRCNVWGVAMSATPFTVLFVNSRSSDALVSANSMQKPPESSLPTRSRHVVCPSALAISSRAFAPFSVRVSTPGRTGDVFRSYVTSFTIFSISVSVSPCDLAPLSRESSVLNAH